MLGKKRVMNINPSITEIERVDIYTESTSIKRIIKK